MLSKETKMYYRTFLSILNPDTQKYTVMKHILENGSIRQDVAWQKYRISRLGAVIYNLTALGADFKTAWLIDEATKTPMKFMTYSLADSFPSEEEVEERKKNAKSGNSSFERSLLMKELREINKKLTLSSLRELRDKAKFLLEKEQEKEEQLSMF